MEDERLIDIEIRLAHHENTIAELNEALVHQQKQLTRLQGVCDTLLAKLGALARGGPAPAAEDQGQR